MLPDFLFPPVKYFAVLCNLWCHSRWDKGRHFKKQRNLSGLFMAKAGREESLRRVSALSSFMPFLPGEVCWETGGLSFPPLGEHFVRKIQTHPIPRLQM